MTIVIVCVVGGIVGYVVGRNWEQLNPPKKTKKKKTKAKKPLSLQDDSDNFLLPWVDLD